MTVIRIFWLMTDLVKNDIIFVVVLKMALIALVILKTAFNNILKTAFNNINFGLLWGYYLLYGPACLNQLS
jgi:hypothetical protein